LVRIGKEHHVAYAFAVHIPPGKTEAVRRLIADSLGPRKTDYDDLQRRSGVTGEAYWLQSDPEHGDTLIVVSDGEASDDRAFQALMADPQTDFDRWYRDQIEAILPIDMSVPTSVPNELLGRWEP
jgi:hypothetical protein